MKGVVAVLVLEKFKEAKKMLDKAQVLRNTNLIYSDFFTKEIGADVYLKPENLQRTGSYKIRGGFNKISNLSPEQKKSGVIAASAGNHAQGVAFSAHATGIPATIVMPVTAPSIKRRNTESYGVNVVLHGENYDDAYVYARELEKEHGYTYVHAYDDLEISTGQGSIAIEILEEMPDKDIIVVPVGGGGLAAGVATCAKLINPKIKIVGVEPAGASSLKIAFEKGMPQALSTLNTIADGAQIAKVGYTIFPYLRAGIDHFTSINDEALVDSLLDLIEQHKMIAEPSGLLSIAVLTQLASLIGEDIKNKKVVSVVSGGNIDSNTVSVYIQHALRRRGRIFEFSVNLPQKPGALASIVEIIAKEGGNIIDIHHNHFANINIKSAAHVTITLEVPEPAVKEKIIKLCSGA